MTAFATDDDLASRLGITMTDPQKTRATALLDLSSGLIRDVARQEISLHEDDELTMPGTRSDRITLPERPVVSIASVTLDGSPLAEGTDWYLRDNTIYRLAHPAVFPLSGHYDRRLRGFGWPRKTLVITYTHGYADDDLPQLVKTTALEAAVRVWSNPEGLLSERVGDTEVTFASYREPSRGLLLTEDERKQIRRFFGSRGTAVMVG